MTTTALSAVPDDDTLTPAADLPRTTYHLTTRTRHRGKLTTAKLAFTALAMLDGGSSLMLMGGASDEQARALRAMLFRITVDDDGVGRDVEPRYLRDDQVSYAWLDGDTAEDQDDDETAPVDGPSVIPDDAALGRLKKSELVGLAETHGVDTDGTNAALAAALGAKRDELAAASTDLAPVDDEDGDEAELVEAAAWRLVWPHEKDEALDEPFELAVDDEFPTLQAAQMHAADQGSSLRRLIILLTDPESIVAPESLNDAVGQIAGAAAGRPTKRSGGSSRSRRARTRSRR